jgi:hypothetical protein
VLGVGDGSGVAVGEVPTGPDTVGEEGDGVAVLLDGVDGDGRGVEREGVGVGEVRDGDGVAWCTGCEVLTGTGVCAVAVRGLT